MKTYNKLVRDLIPDIIEKDGKSCVTKTLDEKEFISALTTKLDEETKEFMEDADITELADVQEVINAIVEAKGLSQKEFENIRKAKEASRGGFDKRIFLISVDDTKKGL
jgi:predicted house-cleaning noncanonical NTP pyrophosphatase (MazG superfamily)